MGKRAKERLEDCTVDTAFFDCYLDNEGMKQIYAGLGNFVQKTIKEAKDAEYIPAVQNDWPTSIEENKADEEENEF